MLYLTMVKCFHFHDAHRISLTCQDRNNRGCFWWSWLNILSTTPDKVISGHLMSANVFVNSIPINWDRGRKLCVFGSSRHIDWYMAWQRSKGGLRSNLGSTSRGRHVCRLQLRSFHACRRHECEGAHMFSLSSQGEKLCVKNWFSKKKTVIFSV